MEKHFLSEEIKNLARTIGLDASDLQRQTNFRVIFWTGTRGKIRNGPCRRRTPRFRRRIEAWGETFQLANLEGLTEDDYDRLFAPLDIDIAYAVFRRNVLLAMRNAEREHPLTRNRTGRQCPHRRQDVCKQTLLSAWETPSKATKSSTSTGPTAGLRPKNRNG